VQKLIPRAVTDKEVLTARLQCAFPNKIKLQNKNTHLLYHNQHAHGHQYTQSMAQLYDKGSSLPVSGIAVRTSDLTTNLHRLKVTSWD
jgi:hypothetical protein